MKKNSYEHMSANSLLLKYNSQCLLIGENKKVILLFNIILIYFNIIFNIILIYLISGAFRI